MSITTAQNNQQRRHIKPTGVSRGKSYTATTDDNSVLTGVDKV